MKKKVLMAAALSALCMSAGAVAITPTKVNISGSQNALFPHYEVSGATSECGGLLVTIYDVGKTKKYAVLEYPMTELVTSGSHSVGLFLDGTELNADDVEDGKPSVYIEMSIVNFCSITETGYPVLASGGIYYPSSGGSSGGSTTRHYKTAQTLFGVVWTDDGVSVLSIKTGKVSKKGVVTVSGSVMGVDGKKLSVKSAKLPVDADERLHGTLQVKGGTTIDITIDEDEMWGTWKGMPFDSSDGYDVGGTFDNDRELTFCFTDGIDADALPDGTIMELLPQYEDVAVKKGKMATAKAASVKWAKPKKGAELPEIYDEASGKGLIVDTAKGKTNLSGLKLSYTPKTGVFKGSFKVYALKGGKLKKYTANVTGIVVNGTGFGMATIKGFGSFPIQVD